MIKIAPSILSANFANIEKDIKTVENDTNCEYLHIDVMDGNFVPNISIGQPFIKSIRKITSMKFDVHLMVEKPERYIEDFKKCGADILTIHFESCVHLHRALEHIKSLGMKAGVTLNPSTPIEMLKPVLDLVDLVLVMSVNPGFGGQSFIENSIYKIEMLSKWKKDYGYNYIIEVDGGINEKTIKKAVDAGAELLVAGSAVFNEKCIKENVENLEKMCR
ncbi:MAG: ribulose-phosphate 3-epimerase [Peptoanaerobacter stomatis]|uniref:ribulose-phosphate 3-epimerase n=1 Tax=Peptoanaerobacter stomatis TaxID=796937 RepID=UPI003F9F7161